MKKKIYHKITNAYEAWWFLYSHPKFMLPERNEITSEEATKLEAEGFWITKDLGGKCYRMWRHLHRHALEENLSIFYTKTNKPGGHGRVDDDRKKNKYVECWLEFGPLEWGYMAGGTYDWDTETGIMNYHDTDLDTGGTTFDEALVNLAKLVRKHYGDYKPRNHTKWPSSGICGKPVCVDCRDTKQIVKELGAR